MTEFKQSPQWDHPTMSLAELMDARAGCLFLPTHKLPVEDALSLRMLPAGAVYLEDEPGHYWCIARATDGWVYYAYTAVPKQTLREWLASGYGSYISTSVAMRQIEDLVQGVYRRTPPGAYPWGASPASKYAWWASRIHIAPRQVDVETLQFLTDVVTAAGLLSHGKTDKALANRINDAACKMRVRVLSTPDTSMPEDELPADITPEDYDTWYAQSSIPGGVGCRFGPRFPATGGAA